jgi:methionine sulfoxide reductase heme-binding subunit
MFDMPFLNSRYFFWLLLALPSIPMMAALSGNTPAPGGPPIAEMLLHPTGEFAARFMIAAMIISPLRVAFPKSRTLQWLANRRRYLGVAAFTYALAHTVLYIVDMKTAAAVLDEFWILGIWTGWLAFFVFIPLAATSTEWAVRKLGRRWKVLQRWVYIAALATLAHWIFVHNNVGPALAHFLPLAALELYRIWRHIAANNTGRITQ